MTSQYRHRRTSISSASFPNPIEPGEITVNTANRQIAVGDAASASVGAPKNLLAIRIFDTSAQYAIGDLVTNNANLYRAKVAIVPGPFVLAQWDDVGGLATINDSPPQGVPGRFWWESDTGILWVYYDDGNSTQWVQIGAGSTTDPSKVAKAGDTMTGALLLAVGEPSAATAATPKSYVDSTVGAAAAAVPAVRYDAAQALTAAQQVQARANIYAAPFDALGWSGMQINGSMEVSQERGTTAFAGPVGYVCDGWQFSKVGTASVSVGTNPVPGWFTGLLSFVYCTVATGASLAAGDIYCFLQNIEGYRISRLAWGTANAQPITIGFWTSHHRTGIYSGVARNGAGNRCYAFTYTHNVGDVAQYNVVTIPGDTAGTWAADNTLGMVITFAIAAPVGGTYTAPTLNSWVAGNYFAGIGQINAVAATSDAFRITGVIVLPGIEAPSAARSPLIMRPYDQELVTCKRYYEKLGSGLHGAAVGPTIFCGAGRYSVEKRVAATLTGIAAPSIYRAGVGYSTGSGSVWSFNVVASDSKGFGFEVNGFTGLVNGAGGIFNGSDQITADARL